MGTRDAVQVGTFIDAMKLSSSRGSPQQSRLGPVPHNESDTTVHDSITVPRGTCFAVLFSCTAAVQLMQMLAVFALTVPV